MKVTVRKFQSEAAALLSATRSFPDNRWEHCRIQRGSNSVLRRQQLDFHMPVPATKAYSEGNDERIAAIMQRRNDFIVRGGS